MSENKIIRFSELTPAKLLHANSVKVVIPDTDAVLDFEHETDGSWTFVTHSKKFDLSFPGCQVMHAINEETVWALYCGLTLTLCGVADKTYDDVEVFYYGRED